MKVYNHDKKIIIQKVPVFDFLPRWNFYKQQLSRYHENLHSQLNANIIFRIVNILNAVHQTLSIHSWLICPIHRKPIRLYQKTAPPDKGSSCGLFFPLLRDIPMFARNDWNAWASHPYFMVSWFRKNSVFHKVDSKMICSILWSWKLFRKMTPKINPNI